MKDILAFLDALMRNNNRPWFQEHKAEYLAVQNRFNAFTEQLIAEVGKFDPQIAQLTVKDCTYRIYKDMRFSKEKIPYKTHMGAYLCPGGKKSGYAGYYFHLEPSESEDYAFGNLLAAGLYNPTPSLAISIRDAIFRQPERFDEVLTACHHYHWSDNAKFKQIPACFHKDAIHADYLKLKTFTIATALPEKLILGDETKLLKAVTELFREAKPCNDFINEVVASGCW